MNRPFHVRAKDLPKGCVRMSSPTGSSPSASHICERARIGLDLRRLAGIVATVLMGTSALVACGQPGQADPAPRSIVFCIDRSRSVPDILVDKAISLAAGTATELVNERSAAAGSPPTTVYVSLTGKDSYSALQPIAPLELSAIPKRTTNPSDDRARERWLAEHFSPARGKANQWSAKVLAYHPPRQSGSDVWGCPTKAADLLARSDDRALVIASDLEPYGHQNRATLELGGVRVFVIYACGAPRADAATCQARRRMWDRAFTAAKAGSVTWLDYQSALAPSALLTPRQPPTKRS